MKNMKPAVYYVAVRNCRNTPLEISLTDAKMGALLALIMDGEGENQNLLDEALILFSPDEIEKLTTAGLIP